MVRQQRNNWLPFAAAIGTGAAAYYVTRQRGQIQNMMQQATSNAQNLMNQQDQQQNQYS